MSKILSMKPELSKCSEALPAPASASIHYNIRRASNKRELWASLGDETMNDLHVYLFSANFHVNP